MSNLAYLRFWFRDFTVERGAHHLEALLTLFPASQTRPDLRLVIRSIDPSQGVTLEREMLSEGSEVRELCAEFLHADTSYQVTTFWDLWQWDLEEGPRLSWSRLPSPVEMTLQGPEFDGGSSERAGQIWMQLGAEHLFTGYGSILSGGADPNQAETRAESDLAWALQDPDALLEYRRNTWENVRQLYGFLFQAPKSLPVERHVLWSEGEADFAEATEQILSLEH